MSLSWLFDCHRSWARNITTTATCELIGAKKGRNFQFNFLSLSHSVYITFHTIMSFRKPCHMPFRKLIPPFTLTAVGRGWELEGQLTYREYRREGPYFVLSFRLLLSCVLCGVTKSNCLKLVLDKVKSTWAMEWVKEWISNRVQY